MRQSRAFWAAFALLTGATALSAANPCVGVFAVFYLALALVSLVAYLVMRSGARRLASAAGRTATDGAGAIDRDATRRGVSHMSRALFGMVALLSVVVAVATLLLTMLGLDPRSGGRAMLPVQLAPFDAAFDLWAVSAVMGVVGGVLLVTAGKDVRAWLGSVA
ncbi:hypothetical protein [Thermophilibacter mediterraneus]|uniref:hypothetical protein n=1 Tax=Thermophilibacter mediterraneus TaxID=1871031 RepID=UPI00320B8E1A